MVMLVVVARQGRVAVEDGGMAGKGKGNERPGNAPGRAGTNPVERIISLNALMTRSWRTPG